MAGRHLLPHHLVRGWQHFLQCGNARLDGLAGATGFLHHEGLQAVADIKPLFLHQPLDLVALAAETNDQRTGQIGMTRVAGHGPPQQIHRLAGHFHATAGAVRECADAVDVRIFRQTLRRKVFSDLVRHCRRAVHCRQHTEVIARGHLAVGTDNAHETGTIRLGKHLLRLIVTRVGVIAIKFAEFKVVRMHVGAGRNVRRCKTDGHRVFEDGFAHLDRPRGDLVPRRHLAFRGKAAIEFGTDGDVTTGNQHVVDLVQPDYRARGRFVLVDVYDAVVHEPVS